MGKIKIFPLQFFCHKLVNLKKKTINRLAFKNPCYISLESLLEGTLQVISKEKEEILTKVVENYFLTK